MNDGGYTRSDQANASTNSKTEMLHIAFFNGFKMIVTFFQHVRFSHKTVIVQ